MKAVNTLLVVAILLFATVMSWTFFAVRGNEKSSLPTAGIGGGPETATVTVDPTYHSQFLTLLPQHGTIAVVHLTNLYDGKDTTETAKKLDENATKLADVIKTLGTSTDRALFLQTFRGHIKEYENYTKAVKAHDQAAMNAAKENLHMHAMKFGDLTHKLMPSISTERAIQLMNDHVTLTLAIVDDHAQGDVQKKLTDIKNAEMQALKFAEELAKGATEANKSNNK